MQHINCLSEVISRKIGGINNMFNMEQVRKISVWMILGLITILVISNVFVRVFVPNSSIAFTEAFSYYEPNHPNPWVDIDIDYGGVRGACEYIEQHYKDRDAIIATSSRSYSQEHLPVYYYLQDVIMEKNVTLYYLLLKDEQTKDSYVNSTIINTLNQVEEVTYHHNRGWVIITERLTSLYGSNEIIDFIVDNLELVYENDKDQAFIYAWS
jgi:hypothetical protein